MSSTSVLYWMSEPILSYKAVNNLVHAAHRLEERRLPFVLKRLVEAIAPEFGTEQLIQSELGPRFAGFLNGYLATVAGRAGVLEARDALLAAADAGVATRIAFVALVLSACTAHFVLAEIAEIFQETKKVVAVGRIEFSIQGVLVHSLCQHFGDVALRVVGDAPPDLRFAAEGLVALEQIGHRLHDINFERHVQFLAVMKYPTVMVRKTPRPQIQIEALVKVADLFGLSAVRSRSPL